MFRMLIFEKICLYWYLEDGVVGLMILYVLILEKARMFVDVVRFLFVGDCGLDGVGLDMDFLLNGGDEYLVWVNVETFFFV